ncbi:MAG: transposase [Deltaproteobacteria bacterium]|nr:transposase [Deltaproteobacteria bacterium]
MHFRISTRKKGDTVYRYGQLVESYRRDDGMPAHRVVASLGRLTEQQAENLKLAFKASKQGQAVVLASEVAHTLAKRKCLANYAYLALAVCLELWRRWGIGRLIDQLLPDTNVDVPVSGIIAALVCQRCFAPDSKLAAVSWFPTTALPELLGLQPGQFHNTRVHRALESLERIERPLQERLARRITSSGPVRVLFLDCTDTWFVGRGPDFASKRVTKEGLFKRQIGIVLLCDADGLPLQWATVEGSHDERQTMLHMTRAVADQPWAQHVPFVMDRAMGSAATVCALSLTGLRFITAVPVHEFAAYSGRIPLGVFDGLAEPGQALDDLAHIERLAAQAEQLGFERCPNGRYLLDLGVVARANTGATDHTNLDLSRARAALLLAQRAQAELANGQLTHQQLAERWSVATTMLRRLKNMLALSAAVQRRIYAGDADRLTVGALDKISRLPPEEQQVDLDAAIDKAGPGDTLRPTRELARMADLEPLLVRAVVVFRPELFARRRGAAEQRLAAVVAEVEEINRRARSPRSRRGRDSILGEVAALLRKHKLANAADIQVTSIDQKGHAVHQVVLEVDQERWRAQRAADGMNLIIAHPDHIDPADEIVRLYYDKDKIEKDFRTIKSVLQLRPVHHRTDHKARAHVSLCVLALLLERTLERHLKAKNIGMSSRAAYDLLGTCFLNQFHDAGAPLYTTTEATPDQRVLLDALDLGCLVEDEVVAGRIVPR